MIMDSDTYSKDTDARQSLVVNVGDRELRSARIIVEHEGTLYKYVKSDSSSATDRWIYSGRLSDVWSIPDYSRMTKLESDIGKGLPSLKVVEYESTNPDLVYSQVYEDAFLFDLSNDEAEMYNLLHPDLPHHDKELNAKVLDKCNALLEEYMQQNTDQMFSEPLDFLHERLDVGDPSMTEDGKFVRPFLTNRHYKMLVVKMLDDEGENVPQGLADLYLNTWIAPEREREEDDEATEKVELWELELDQIDAEIDGEENGDEDEEEEEVEEEGVVVVDPADAENEDVEDDNESAVEMEADEEDELVAEIEIDSKKEPKQFRLEVMLPIILAAAIIVLVVCVLLLYHFVYKTKKDEPSYKLIDATDLMIEQDRQDSVPSVSSYETF